MDFLPKFANTGATTLTVNTLAPTPVIKLGGAALTAGDLATSAIAKVIYDGTSWELQNPQTSTTALSVAFSGITGGTNTSAAMLVGSGASLAPTGTGTITATELLTAPTECATGSAPIGVDVFGNAQTCTAYDLAGTAATDLNDFLTATVGAHTYFGNNTSGALAPAFDLIGATDMSPNWYAPDTGAADAAAVALNPAPTAPLPPASK